MTTELVNQETKDNLPAELAGDYEGVEVTPDDIVIPKILVLSKNSKKVENGLGKIGEFRDTLSNELFGDDDNPVEFVPIGVTEKWLEYDIVEERNKRKRVFVRSVPYVKSGPDKNSHLPYSEGKLERDRVIEAFVLLPMQVAEGSAIPYILSFKRTSLKAGKKLFTQMYVKNRQSKVTPYSVALNLTADKVAKDDFTYLVQDVTPSRKATDEEVAEARHWRQLLATTEVKVHQGDDDEE